MMRFGAHVSVRGGVENGPKNAAEIDADIFQFFSRPPQGGKAKPIDQQLIDRFKQAMKQFQIKDAYIHAPYFINLASGQTHIREGSIRVLCEELERGSSLGCRAMMFHPGSAKETGEIKGLQLVVDGLNRILDGYQGACQLLIEISAGAGMVMGDTFEEIAGFLTKAERGDEIGVCFDTQHAFASGYDIQTKQGLDQALDQFDQLIGLQRLVASHCNDSKVACGEHKDRHEHLGKGYLGEDFFRFFVQHPKLQHLDLLLETPMDKEQKKEITLLRSFQVYNV